MDNLIKIRSLQSWCLLLFSILAISLCLPDTIVLANDRGTISTGPARLDFGAIKNGSSTSTLTPPQSLSIFNFSNDPINWTAYSSDSWAIIYPASGTIPGNGSSKVLVSTAPCGLAATIHNATLTFTWMGSPTPPPTSVPVTLNVKNPADDLPPFGAFDDLTPVGSSTVSGSIPVTGWALDDVAPENVQIQYQQVSPVTSEVFYIGDAVFVDWSRLGVPAAYPNYPLNHSAGWGYMLLTNFLPGGGNGTYNIKAISTDTEGYQTTLGTKTIVCDNATAVKPFGAIDTPTQGGTASGTNFLCSGWVLDPQPNIIPMDGSTISVWIDSVNVGHPSYNIYRADIAEYFPGYANTSGSGGEFYFDTTMYSDGIHSISWSATDTGGYTDGIGSRYFTINNAGESNSIKNEMSEKALAEIPNDYTVAVQYRKGFDSSLSLMNLVPDSTGVMHLTIQENDRIEVHLNETEFTGYSQNNDLYSNLPIGSTLDSSGIFSWMPGPGYSGTHDLIFIRGTTTKTQKTLKVKIISKQAPFPTITVNDLKGLVNVSSGTSLAIDISLDPSGGVGVSADWWAASYSPTGEWKYYNLSSAGYVTGLAVSYQGQLVGVSDFNLANLNSLSVGTHYFYFGVDLNQNGTLDMDQLYYDFVTVQVSP